MAQQFLAQTRLPCVFLGRCRQMSIYLKKGTGRKPKKWSPTMSSLINQRISLISLPNPSSLAPCPSFLLLERKCFSSEEVSTQQWDLRVITISVVGLSLGDTKGWLFAWPGAARGVRSRSDLVLTSRSRIASEAITNTEQCCLARAQCCMWGA